jgi:hypothetical protein
MKRVSLWKASEPHFHIKVDYMFSHSIKLLGSILQCNLFFLFLLLFIEGMLNSFTSKLQLCSSPVFRHTLYLEAAQFSKQICGPLLPSFLSQAHYECANALACLELHTWEEESLWCIVFINV